MKRLISIALLVLALAAVPAAFAEDSAPAAPTAPAQQQAGGGKPGRAAALLRLRIKLAAHRFHKRCGSDTTDQKCVDAKAKIDTRNGAGETALMLAAANGSPEAVRLLLDHGADPRARTKRNETALGNAGTSGEKYSDACLCNGGTTTACEDNNSCTADLCDPTTGCAHVNAPDGTACSAGICRSGTCVVPQPEPSRRKSTLCTIGAGL